MDTPPKRKVTVKLTFDGKGRPSPNFNISRPPSPLKPKSTLQPSFLPPPTVVRPKSKVNGTRKPTSVVSVIPTKSGAAPTPRPRSPFKPQSVQVRSRPVSPVRNVLTAPPLVTTHSTPSTPERRHYIFSEDSADDNTHNRSKSRLGNLSLHHAASFSSLHARSASAVTPIFNRDENGTLQAGITQGRVKAKVSALVQQAESFNEPSSSPKMRSIQPRVRAPSISSSVSLNGHSSVIPTAPTFYPITTATAAANPHRYATTRASPPSGGHHHYLPFLSSNDDVVTKLTNSPGAKVDPFAIAPLMHSPPTSAVSFSSQSSQSYNTESSAASADSRTSVQTFSSRADASDDFDGSANGLVSETEFVLDRLARTRKTAAAHRESDDDESSDDRKVRAEAKSNRKIADLEITNRSLMTINASLESVKHRQAKEIRELRRKLRESRLILPPRAYRAVKASSDPDDDEDEGDEESGSETNRKTVEETYRRVRVMIELLLESGRKALESKVHDHQEGSKGGTKVLSAYEVRSWRDSSVEDTADNDAALVDGYNDVDVDADLEHSSYSARPTSATLLISPDHDYDFASEEEVESMITPDPATSSSLSPIHIVSSP